MKTWRVEFTKKSRKQFDNLDNSVKIRIKKAVEEKLIKNPGKELQPLLGEMGGYYKFRVGDYRLICHKENDALIILVLTIGHRSAVYKI